MGNNIKCVELFTSKGGIISILGEQTKTRGDDAKKDGEAIVNILNRRYGPKAEDPPKEPKDYYQVMTLQKVGQALQKKGKPRDFVKEWKECFSIKHYAGIVMYTVQEFVPKSRDKIDEDIAETLAASSNKLVAKIFKNSGGVAKTVGEKFKDQLEHLVGELEKGDTRFVRCIKTNDEKVPGKLQRPKVLEQLICGGVVAALEVRSAGLPSRITYADFYERYKLLLRGWQKGDVDKKAMAKQVLSDYDSLSQDGHNRVTYAFGKTKVFMVARLMGLLDRIIHFKMYVYAQRIQLRLWTSRARKIASFESRLQEVEEAAKSRGLLLFPVVVDAIKEASSRVEPLTKLLREVKASSDSAPPAIRKALEPHAKQLPQCAAVVESVAHGIHVLSQKKERVEVVFQTWLAQELAEVDQFDDQVKEIQQSCDEFATAAEPGELEDAKQKCTQASQLAETLRKDLRTIKQGGLEDHVMMKTLDASSISCFPEAREPYAARMSRISSIRVSILDLSQDYSVFEDCYPQIKDCKARFKAALKAAEESGGFLIKVRAQFREAIQELAGPLKNAQDKLMSFQEGAQECIVEGLTEVSEAINKAEIVFEKLEDLEKECKFPDKYREVAATFLEAVQNAESSLVAAQVELEKRKVERKARVEMLERIENLLSQLQMDDLPKFVRDLDGVPQRVLQLNEYSEQLVALRSRANDDLESWSKAILQLNDQIIATLPDLRDYIEQMRKEHQGNFAARRAMFEKFDKGAKNRAKTAP